MGSDSTTYLSSMTCVHKVRNSSICTLHAKSVPYILFFPKLVCTWHFSWEARVFEGELSTHSLTQVLDSQNNSSEVHWTSPWRQAAQGSFPTRKWTKDSEISARKMTHDNFNNLCHACCSAQGLVLVRSQVHHFQRCTRQLASGLPRMVQTCFICLLGSTLDNCNDLFNQCVKSEADSAWGGITEHKGEGLWGAGMPDATLLVLPTQWLDLVRNVLRTAAAALLHCCASVHSSSKHLYLGKVLSAWILLPFPKKKKKGQWKLLALGEDATVFLCNLRIRKSVKCRTTKQKNIFLSAI